MNIQIKTFFKGFVLALLLASNSVLAADSSAFQKRFKILRDQEGKLLGIKDSSIAFDFKVRPYIKMIKSQLLEEQALIANKARYEDNILEVLHEDFENSWILGADREQNEKVVLASLKALEKLDVDAIFSNEVVNEVVSLYESKMSNVLIQLDPSMLAVTNDPTYFYKRNVTYQVVKWGLDFAKKRLSSIPMLNTASYIMVQVEKLITERRAFHQNMLLHYLENFSPEELGLTKEEVDLIWSSIYESRIVWFNFMESSAAKANWAKYGINNFYANFRLASTTLRDFAGTYSSLDARLNYGFQKVTLNGDSVAINLFDKEGMFVNRPAIAYNFSKPTLVARKRVLLSLAQLGLSFVPVSAAIKDNVTTFIKSFYEKQRITEGALFGYLETNKETAHQAQFLKQYMNPFEMNLILQ